MKTNRWFSFFYTTTMGILACTGETGTPVVAPRDQTVRDSSALSAGGFVQCPETSSTAPRLRIDARSKVCRDYDIIYNPEEAKHPHPNPMPEKNLVVVDPKRVPTIPPNPFGSAKIGVPSSVFICPQVATTTPLITQCYAVSVTPKGSPVDLPPNSTGHHASFTVKNTGQSTDTYALACSATGPVICKSLSVYGVTLVRGQSATVNASYNVGAKGTGVLTVNATGNGDNDAGSYNVFSGNPPQPGTGDNGWFVPHVETWNTGNVNTIRRSLEIPSNISDSSPSGTGAWIYAPTHHPQGGCLELTMAYGRGPGQATTTRGVGWWDWCSATPSFVTFEDMNDPSWVSNYVITTTWGWPPENNQVVDQVYWGLWSVAGTTCMQGILYNFNARHYDQKAYSCGTPQVPDGWSIWESWYVMDHLTDQTQCPTIPRVDAEVMVDTDTTPSHFVRLWLDQANVTPLPSSGICWTTGYYRLQWYLGDFHDWVAYTP